MPSAIGSKRKAGGVPSIKLKKTPVSKPALSESESQLGWGDEEENHEDDEAVMGGLVDPMIDIQSSGDEASDALDEDDDEDEGEDEDEDGSSALASASTTPHANQAGPSRKKGLFAPPTLAEMETLQSNMAATASSSTATSFTLQLSALLSSTLLASAPHPELKSLLTNLHGSITSLPSLEPISPRMARKKVGGDMPPLSVAPVEFTVDKSSTEVNWKLGWEKPLEVFVGGSWGVVGGYKAAKGEAGGVDMVVVMPEDLFTPKDRLDYRYFHKRAYYLAIIKSSLQKASAGSGALAGAEVDWAYINGDQRRPIIAVTAGKVQGLKHRMTIRIHASAPPNTFPTSALSPTRSSIRHESLSSITASASALSPTSTPLYNTSLLHDTLHKSSLLHLHRLSQLLPDRGVDSFLALWRIWCTRRGISRDRGASGYFAGMVLGWVIQGGEVGVEGSRGKFKKVRGLGKGLGYWAALRAAWEFLAQTDFEATPVFMASDEEEISRSEHLGMSLDIFVESTGSLNLLSGWDKGDIQLLRHHARETLALLEDSSVDNFAEVFLRDRQIGMDVFDECIKIDVSNASTDEDLLIRSERPNFLDRIANKVATILRQGLSDRVHLVHVAPVPGHETALQVGLIFNPSSATRLLDVGPSSDRPELGKAFNELWGEKADLRRFKDGSIAESVLWDITRPEDAAMIPGRIVQYLLDRHFSIPSRDIQRFSSLEGWATILQIPDTARDAISTANSQKQGFRPILDAYQEFYKFLKSIDDDLPLSILNVTPASELLRYSSAFIPHPIDLDRYLSSSECTKYVPRVEVVLQFESSPKWPEDLSAVQNVKMAILEKLANLINLRLKGSRAGVVLDEGVHSEIEDRVALEVFLPQGSVFLLRIHYEKEQSLLQRALDPSPPIFGTSLPTPPRRLVLPAMVKHTRRFIHAPAHHSFLAPLHHRYPSYSTATRLLKRWFAAHMLSPHHVSTEAVELIMASVYITPGSLGVPHSATCGFLRALEKLGGWDWRAEPVFIPPHGEDLGSRPRFGEEKRKEGIKMFEDLRKKDPEVSVGVAGGGGGGKAWILITEDDTEGLRWTKGVGRVVAARVTVLARASRSVVEGWLSRDGMAGEVDSDVRSLFTTPLEHYDTLLHLDPSVITRYAESVSPDAAQWESGRFRNLVEGSEGDDTEEMGRFKAGWDPVGAFVRDLQRRYAETFLVFYDIHGGTVIGLLWNPARDQPRSYKAFLGYSTEPTKGQGALVRINKDAVLGEVARLGRGLITRIERKKQ